MILKFINYEQEYTQTKYSLKLLNADMYFEEILQASYPWSLLTSIEQCILRNKETVFTFQMMHTLLSSTIDIENASSLPPIQLTISKFKDGDSSMSPEVKDTMGQLRYLANLRGLIIQDHKVKLNANQEITPSEGENKGKFTSTTDLNVTSNQKCKSERYSSCKIPTLDSSTSPQKCESQEAS
ncbi:hypothetical protein FGO68_gene7912 [Halteria grandinella]|uniref:Uncharacterized protein n=1 Tax=Halteria grandinella TaxID=5974 RepID=A0A8J8NFC7_HALGN|nr:hypothetical protein FGO68_gene7912 [Halteria grandinella]